MVVKIDVYYTIRPFKRTPGTKGGSTIRGGTLARDSRPARAMSCPLLAARSLLLYYSQA